VEKHNFITIGALKYLEFWNLNMPKYLNYTNIMKPYIDYQEVILKMLANPLPQQSPVLLESFWPTSNWRVNHSQFIEPSSPIFTDKENIVLEPFYGPKNMKPTMKTTPYTPLKIYTMEISSLHNHQYLRFTLYGWAKRIVMLSRMRQQTLHNGACAMVGVVEERHHEQCGVVLKLLVRKVEMQFK
jgi:hypothetical protein